MTVSASNHDGAGRPSRGAGFGSPRGVPFTGDSLVDMLRHRAAVQASDVAYTYLRDGEVEASSLSWSELDRASRAVAGWLQTRVSPGDRAVLLYPPGLDFIAAFFGCLYAGVLAVPVLPPNGGRARRALERITSIVQDAAPRCTLTSTELQQQFALDSRDGLPGTIALGTPWLATDRLTPDEGEPWSPVPADRTTIAFLQYTSGSTARPKGVIVTHGNLLHNLMAAFALGDTSPSSVSVSWLPVTHDMGLIEGVLQPAFSGCPAYLMSPGAFLQRPVRWLRAISRYRATRSGAPNFAYDLAVNRIGHADRAGLDLTTWSAAYNGAEPIRHDTMEAFAAAYASAGFDASAFRPCYGLAESTLLVTTRRWTGTSEAAVPVSCGSPAEGTRVRIVDPAAHVTCADGETGEIQVAGESVAMGYWNRPHETAATFGDCVGGSGERWLRTGDLGYVSNGELYVTGRIKDLLIVRGTKHFPQDLERTAELQHHAVRTGAVAAVAVANGVRGDRVALVAEVDSRQLSDRDGAQLITDLRQAIADSHGIQLHGVALVPPGTVPRTTSGKLQRFLCREAWLNSTLEPLAMWCESA
jgi:acyl-CoA synthetase (AMP-forming)/AMP-acid ligase II